MASFRLFLGATGAPPPATNADAECATATGAVLDAAVTIGTQAGTATGTGEGLDATGIPGWRAPAETATSTGTALDTAFRYASAGLAEATGLASNATASTSGGSAVSGIAGLAAGAACAYTIRQGGTGGEPPVIYVTRQTPRGK